MTRSQILNEAFTKAEIETINNHEPQIRAALADLLNPLILDGESTIAKGMNVERASNVLLKRIFRPSIKEYPRTYATISDIVYSLLASPRYAKNASDIVKDIQTAKVTVDMLFKDTFRLTDVTLNSLTRKFLIELYNIPVSFGGGNTIGKGELCFAALLEDAKLSPRKNNSKCDLITKDGLPIELKSDGGRLDGSGIRPTRVSVERLFNDFIVGALKDELGIRDFSQNILQELDTLNDNITENAKILGNPFSRKAIQTLWFGLIPEALRQLQANYTELDVQSTLATALTMIYSHIYQDTGFGSEAKFVTDRCEELSKVCLSGNASVEDFVTLDTIIRSRIYIALSKDTESSNLGYLIFTKVTGDDIYGCRISYLAGQDRSDWQRKANTELHITPSNDNVRTAHQVKII